jgi:hypothetical protein
MGYVNASRNFAVVGLNVTSGSLTVNGTVYQIGRGTGEYLNSSRTGGYLRGQHNNATFSYLTLQLGFTNSTTIGTSHHFPRYVYSVYVMVSGGVSNGNVNLKGELIFANQVTNHKAATRPYNYRLLLQGTETGLP